AAPRPRAVAGPGSVVLGPSGTRPAAGVAGPEPGWGGRPAGARRGDARPAAAPALAGCARRSRQRRGRSGHARDAVLGLAPPRAGQPVRWRAPTRAAGARAGGTGATAADGRAAGQSRSAAPGRLAAHRA